MDEIKKFEKAMPYIIGVEVGPEDTYVKTMGHNGLTYGLKVPTTYACKALGTDSVGGAFSYLSEIAEANRNYLEKQHQL